MGFMALVCILANINCTGCHHCESSDGYIDEFHEAYFGQLTDEIKIQQVALYVDNSTCIANAMNDGSKFYNDMVAVLTSDNIGEYYSIKGKEIVREEGSKYQLLKSVQEMHYAEIKEAAERIANGNCE